MFWWIDDLCGIEAKRSHWMAYMLKLFPTQRCCSKITDTFLICKQVLQEIQQTLKNTRLVHHWNTSHVTCRSWYLAINLSAPRLVCPTWKRATRLARFRREASTSVKSVRRFDIVYPGETKHLSELLENFCFFVDWKHLTSLGKQKHEEIRNVLIYIPYVNNNNKLIYKNTHINISKTTQTKLKRSMIQLASIKTRWIGKSTLIQSLRAWGWSAKGRVPIVKIQEDQFTLPKTNMTMENRQSENKQNV